MSLIIRAIKIKATVISDLLEWPSSINQQTSAGEDVEKREAWCAVGGIADWCNHCRKQYRVSLKN